MAKLYGPTGVAIRGTLDQVPGCALLDLATVRRNDRGELEFEYEGETTIFWNDQTTQRQDGERLFVDEADNVWRESQLELRDSQ